MTHQLIDYSSDPTRLMALMMGREGRGEANEDFRRACGKVVLNRCKASPREGFRPDVIGNILYAGAFSSFAEPGKNPVGNQLWFPDETAGLWRMLMEEAKDALAPTTPDPSHGAHFYYTTPIEKVPHSWPPVLPAAVIGTGHFFRLA